MTQPRTIFDGPPQCIKDGPYPYRWSTAEREAAKKAASFAADHVLNGPAAGDLRRASLGGNEDLLFAVHLLRAYNVGR